jgi:hypothetical protein
MHPKPVTFPFIFLLILYLSSCAGAAAYRRAEAVGAPVVWTDSIQRIAVQWTTLSPGIEFAATTVAKPSLELRALRVDLAHPSVSVIVGPAASGPGTVPSVRTTTFARDNGCAAAVNGTPFDPASSVEGEERRVVGVAIRNGVPISVPDGRYAALIFQEDGTAKVVEQSALPEPEKRGYGGIRHAVGGFFVVLENGVSRGHPTRRFPRTAAGVSADGRTLILLTVDGRRRRSVGSTEPETGTILAALGAREGLILDGGGSTTMAIRLPDGRIAAANVPIHGGIPGRERAVGVCLGIFAGSGLPPPTYVGTPESSRQP